MLSIRNLFFLFVGIIGQTSFSSVFSEVEKIATLKVQATYETDPVETEGDAADDSAVWVHPTDPAKSLIVATDKKAGLLVYSLKGKLIDSYAFGKINNIDVRDKIVVDGNSTQVLVGSDRSARAIALFMIDQYSNKISKLGEVEMPFEPYGICASHQNQNLEVFVTTKKGLVDHWSIAFEAGDVRAKRLGQIKFESQTEGCVVDDESGFLFVSEEDRGLWKVDLRHEYRKALVDEVGENGNLVADVEGVAIHRAAGDARVVVSSQGENSFHMYDLESGKHLGKFKVVDGDAIDGVSETDGIEIVSQALGPNFPRGLIVVQDGENYDSAGNIENQNFKILDWRLIEL